MTRKTTTPVKLSDKVLLIIKGSYYGGFLGSWEEPPEEPSFEIDSVELAKGTLTELLEEINEKLPKGQDLFEFLSDKACEAEVED